MSDHKYDTLYAGFTLAGYVQSDGSVTSTTGEKFLAWPTELTVGTTTFTLESVDVFGEEDDPRGRYANAEYV